jgi:hypothetical protein
MGATPDAKTPIPTPVCRRKEMRCAAVFSVAIKFRTERSTTLVIAKSCLAAVSSENHFQLFSFALVLDGHANF